MAIVQDAFEIPEEILKGLITGKYSRFGSIVRYAKGPNGGNIVTHLPSVELNDKEKVKNIVSTAKQLIKEHKKETIASGAALLAVAGGAYLFGRLKRREPKVVTEFKEKFENYFEAIKNGQMTIEVIEDLMKALEALKCDKRYEEITIQLRTAELEVLVKCIYDYTVKLASDNGVDVTISQEKTQDSSSESIIISLQSYLEEQKKIFEKAS
ncbi:MAG: hypothetical protein MJ146_03690 [Clostridia bacterium]|nr:hypothetical protein [Clostridia bacterium]